MLTIVLTSMSVRLYHRSGAQGQDSAPFRHCTEFYYHMVLQHTGQSKVAQHIFLHWASPQHSPLSSNHPALYMNSTSYCLLLLHEMLGSLLDGVCTLIFQCRSIIVQKQKINKPDRMKHQNRINYSAPKSSKK